MHCHQNRSHVVRKLKCDIEENSIETTARYGHCCVSNCQCQNCCKEWYMPSCQLQIWWTSLTGRQTWNLSCRSWVSKHWTALPEPVTENTADTIQSDVKLLTITKPSRSAEIQIESSALNHILSKTRSAHSTAPLLPSETFPSSPSPPCNHATSNTPLPFHLPPLITSMSTSLCQHPIPSWPWLMKSTLMVTVRHSQLTTTWARQSCCQQNWDVLSS